MEFRAKKKGGLVSPAFQALLHNLLSQYVKVSKSTHATEYEKKACQKIGLQKYNFFEYDSQRRLKFVF